MHELRMLSCAEVQCTVAPLRAQRGLAEFRWPDRCNSSGAMPIAVWVVVILMLAPVVLYIRHVAFVVPRRGRKMQEQQWAPLANKLGGTMSRATGGARFSRLQIPFGATLVEAFVADRAAIDATIRTGHVKFGGWRTFVHARVAGPTASFTCEASAKGDATFQLAGHKITAELQTPPQLIARRLTPDLRNALATLGTDYRYVIAGPNVVSIEMPGVCARAELLEAAIYVAGCSAQPLG